MIKLSADAQAGPQLNGVFGDDEDEDALAASLKKILLPKKLRRLAIRDALININLEGLDHECLPAAEQGNKLATAKVCLSVQLFNFVLHFVRPAMCQVNLHDKGILKPFVFAELKEFLPAWASQKEEDKSSSKKLLSFPLWSIAFDRYALAAAADGQLNYCKAMAHKNLVTKVCGCLHVWLRLSVLCIIVIVLDCLGSSR